MLSRLTYLQSAKDKSGDRQAYQERIASIHRVSYSAEPKVSVDEAQVEVSTPEAPAQAAPGRRISFVAKRLFRWFVLLLLAAALVLLIGVIWFVWGSSMNSNTKAVEVKPQLPMTAKNAHQLAEPMALNWAADAELIGVSATWAAGQKFESGAGDWSLLYYSPSMASMASITVYDGQARMITTHGVSRVIEGQHHGTWNIDSEAAVDLLKAAGGDEFLRAQPDATVSMSLDFSLGNAWRVRFIDQMSRRIFSAQVDVESGEITDIQQSW